MIGKPSEGATRARGIDRAIGLLECLHSARAPLRIGEIARRLKAPRSTTYEIVNRFLQAGILEAYGDDGKFFFGRAMHFYAADYLGTNILTRRAQEEVNRLAELANETTEFCMLHGNKYAVVHMRTGARMFRISSEIGVRVPIPWTASGRLLLDHLSRDQIRDFVPKADFVLPNGRRIDLDAFCAEIGQARQDGYCVTSGLVDGFTRCLAAPIRDPAGIAIATVCFVVPPDTSAAETSRLVGLLMQSGRSLSRYVVERR